MIFASTRTPKGAGKDKEETNSAITGQRNNDLFLVKQDENGAWLAPVELEDEVNTEFDEGTPFFQRREYDVLHLLRTGSGRAAYF